MHVWMVIWFIAQEIVTPTGNVYRTWNVSLFSKNYVRNIHMGQIYMFEMRAETYTFRFKVIIRIVRSRRKYKWLNTCKILRTKFNPNRLIGPLLFPHIDRRSVLYVLKSRVAKASETHFVHSTLYCGSALFNDIVNCCNYTASVIDDWVCSNGRMIQTGKPQY
jgi:hypothetical protein